MVENIHREQCLYAFLLIENQNIYCQIVAQLEYNPKSFSLAVLSYKQYVEANVES